MFTSRGESMGRRDSGSSSNEADPPCMGSGYICKQIFYKSLLKNQQWKNYNICCAASLGYVDLDLSKQDLRGQNPLVQKAS
jgi:hypothetical protein